MSHILEISQLKNDDLFKEISLKIEENKFITISGPNNCGKTTLIRILSREIETNLNITLYNQNITEYKKEDYLKIVQSIIPKEILFLNPILEEELYFNSNKSEKETKDLINYIVSGLKIKKILQKKVSTLNNQELVLSQIALALVSEPKILLLDDISSYFNKKELDQIFEFLNDYRKKKNLTLIITTIDLDISLKTDYLYILNEGTVALEGEPLKVLEKDNIINKIGLSLPFMIDLSVKLRDYDLLDEMELDLDRMVDKLWN